MGEAAEVINWIHMAALKVNEETIVKCLKKAHFLPHSKEAVNLDEDNLNIISAISNNITVNKLP